MKLFVTYFELTTFTHAPLTPPDTLATVEKERLSREEYLSLYRSIGEEFEWDERLRLDPINLSHMLSCCLDIFVLRVSNEVAGMCEFDRQKFPDIELVNFGLLSSFRGRGLGRYLLQHSLNAIWDSKPKRVWLHTDTKDHPKAIPTYKQAGFREFMNKYEDPDDPTFGKKREINIF